MGAFDHVLVLLSFVFALALTHLLSRVGSYIAAYRRVRFSGLLALAIVNAVVVVFMNWLLLWSLRGWRDIDLVGIAVLFVFSIALYFICVVAAPEPPADGPIDMGSLYAETYRPYYVLVLIFMLICFAVNFIYLKTPTPQMFIETNIGTIPGLLPSILSLSVRARWAQWVSGAVLLVANVGFMIYFATTI